MDDQTPRKPRKTHAGKPRFSLFAAPQSQPNGPAHIADDEEEEEEEEGVGMEDAVGRQEDDGGGGGEDGDGGDDGEEGEDHTIHAPRRSISNWNRPAQSDDKLRESLYELREMNEVFDGFLTALEAARGHNEVNWTFLPYSPRTVISSSSSSSFSCSQSMAVVQRSCLGKIC